MPCFPQTYVTLHEALARIGEALVNGWDGSEVSRQAPSENDAVLAAGGTWIDREYDKRLWSVGLPRLCPPSAEAATRLAQVVEIVREWSSAGRLRLQILGDEGYKTAPLRAVLRDDAVFLTGHCREASEIEAVVVLRAEIDAALTEKPTNQVATQKSFVSKAELKATYKRYCEECERKNGRRPGRDATRAWGKDLYGPRVTQDMLEEVWRRDNEQYPRNGGRPSGRIPARKTTGAD